MRLLLAAGLNVTVELQQPFWQALVAGAVGGALAIVAALVGAFGTSRFQSRSGAQEARRSHRVAVKAVHEELAGVARVIDLMLGNQSVMMLPVSDVAYRSMGRELLTSLAEDLISLVVKAYAQMPLLINAVEYAGELSRQTASQTSPRGRLLETNAHQIRLLAEDVHAAASGLSAYAASFRD